MNTFLSSELRPWRLAPAVARVVFYTFFALVFLLSGVLTVMPVIPYRMALVSFLVVPLLFLYRFKLDKVTTAFALLVLSIAASALVNRTSLLNFLLFLRIPMFAFLTYFLADRYLNRDNVRRVFRLLLVLGYVQLPVVIIQLAIGRYFPSTLRGKITKLDFDFGTFRWKGDSAMSLFLILLVVALLFSPRVRALVSRPAFTSFYFSLTVLLANSRLAHLVLLFVWLVYLATVLWRREIKANRSHLVAFAAFLAMMLFVDVYMGTSVSALSANLNAMRANGRVENGSTSETKADAREAGGQSPKGVDLYLKGGYARGGALRYFWSRGISWFGDGPSAYYNPVKQIRLRGNRGHFFTFYSEVGLVGWGVSVLVFLSMVVYRSKNGALGLGLAGLLMFVVMLLMGLTLETMNDVSAVFAYVLIGRYVLLPDTHGPSLRRHDASFPFGDEAQRGGPSLERALAAFEQPASGNEEQ